MKKIIYMAVAASMTLSLGSCHIYKKYETPDSTALTAEYKQARQAEPDSAAFGNLLWEDVFTDPVLVDLINRALAENTSLRNAQLNVEIADAQLRGARLAYLPSLALTPNGAGASYAGSDLSWTYTIPASASWEIDVFAKLLNSKRGAQVAVYKSEAYAQAVRSRIIAGVANCYYAIASVERQLHLYRTTAQLWKESVQMMKDMKEAGRTTEAAVVQMTANYNNVLAGITDLEVSLDQLNNTMSLLMNTMPQTWAVSPDASLQVPEMLIQGVPMQYLAMRPDVAAAEQDLAVAYYATNSARAAFYPGITISAQGGFTNLLGSFVKNPGDWFYNLAGSLVAPIFSRGQNIARLKASKVQQQQAMNNFEYTLLTAAAEVSDGLTTYRKATEKSTYLAEQVANLEKSVEYTIDLFQYSNGTYLEVITAQQSLLGAQMAQLTNELTTAQSIINLYQSLGGGR
ncbi:MAG: TolC family protein [Bacteroides sp.]|nr:TolC family protein [Bacteroides sp.]MCM1456981.1 TolC family protein [Lachnoclostridium sp.]